MTPRETSHVHMDGPRARTCWSAACDARWPLTVPRRRVTSSLSLSTIRSKP